MVVLSPGIVPRRVEHVLAARSAVEPVVAIHGPRSVGKSTVLRRFATNHGVEVIDLDELVVRDAASASPGSAVAGATPVCIDEYQHAAEVLDALKARMNREGAVPGTAVLTGSTRQHALPRLAQSLTGRMHTLVLWPLSQGEIYGEQEDLVASLYRDPDATIAAHPRSSTSREEYADRICRGGFPLALGRAEADRNRWFDDYLRTCVERDALELSRIQQRQALATLFARLSGQTAQVLNVAKVADAMEMNRKTVENHVRLLEDLYLVTRLPAWGRTLAARATATPKIHVIDSGLAARQLRVNSMKLATLDPAVLTDFGHLLETFVLGELRKQVSWLDESVVLGHWRTSDGDEIDLVIEYDDGAVIAFEIKAGERVSGGDFRGLRKLRDALGDRFRAGVAFSTGSRSYTYEDRLHVLPVDRLWRTNA